MTFSLKHFDRNLCVLFVNYFFRQQKVLEELITDVQTMRAARHEAEHKLQEEKMQYKEINEKLIAEEKSNLELHNEISAVNLLISQVGKICCPQMMVILISQYLRKNFRYLNGRNISNQI